MSKREHKKQIWLRPDQCGLVVDCLEFVRKKLSYDLSDGACKIAARYTERQIDEILIIIRNKSESTRDGQ